MPNSIKAHQYWFCAPQCWFKLLIENNGVQARYFGKVLFITLLSLFSWPFQLLNSFVRFWKGRKIKPGKDPVFIIGHWRGGTTFLHYLMAQDSSFGYLTYFHAFIPNLAFVGGSILKRALGMLIPKKRPQDNIELSMDLPTEEENPLSTFSTCSASHSFFFPLNESYYRKYVLFNDTSANEKKNWQRDYKQMLDRISVHQKGKHLLIKNPHNTARILELMELYPKAKFIHIYRNPYEIFPSTYLMYDLVVSTQFLQEFTKTQLEQKIIYYYASMMKRFFANRASMPEDQLVEVRFEDFEKDPLREIRRIYNQLNLSLSPEALSCMKKLVDRSRGYQKNIHECPSHIRKQIEQEWAFSFEKMGYKITP